MLRISSEQPRDFFHFYQSRNGTLHRLAPDLPADIYYVIADKIEDPTTFHNFMQANRTSRRVGLQLKKKKLTQFFEVSSGFGGCILRKRFLYERPIRTLERHFAGKRLIRSGNLYDRNPLPSKEGEWKEFFLNGKLKTVMTYRFGILNGLTQIFSSKGVKTSEGRYVNGRKEGLWSRYYNDSGRIKSVSTYQRGRQMAITCFPNQ